MSRVVVLVLTALLAAACVQRGDESARSGAAAAACDSRIIVGFVAEPDAQVLAQLTRVASARLEPLDAVAPNLRVFALTANGPESECLAAMERLRQDPRVSSVDVDARRAHHEPQHVTH